MYLPHFVFVYMTTAVLAFLVMSLKNKDDYFEYIHSAARAASGQEVCYNSNRVNGYFCIKQVDLQCIEQRHKALYKNHQ